MAKTTEAATLHTTQTKILSLNYLQQIAQMKTCALKSRGSRKRT